MLGGTSDNVANRARVRQEILDSGRCSHCDPHDGENYGFGGHRRHGKWFTGDNGNPVFRASKPKHKK